MRAKKRIISITLEKPMSEFIDKQTKLYGMKATDYLRGLIKEKMEKIEVLKRPEIHYHSAHSPRISADSPLYVSEEEDLKKKIVATPMMMQLKKQFEKAEKKCQKKGIEFDPKILLKKVSKKELKEWKNKPPVHPNT